VTVLSNFFAIFVADPEAKKARVFVPGQLLQLSLMFARKDRSLLERGVSDGWFDRVVYIFIGTAWR
jgi:hypothetical protein